MIALYLLVAFGWAWAGWGLCVLIAKGEVALPLTLTLIIGSFGPFIAAGLCAGVQGGVRGAARFYGRVLQWRMGWDVAVAALLLVPALAVLSAWLYARQFHLPLAFNITLAELPLAYLWLFVLGGPVAEEFGWSWLSDALDGKLPVPFATLLLGVIWGFWHLPLFFLVVPGLTQHYMPFGLFLLMSVSARFLFSWAYHRGGRNILSNLLFHNALNLGLSIVTIVPPLMAHEHLRLWYLTVLIGLAAAALWRVAPPSQLNKIGF